MADIADPNQPFLDHLVALLAVYEHGTSATPIPRYDGPSNWQTASILRSIESLGRRAPAADAATGSISSSAASSSSTSDSAIPHDVAGAAGAHALSDSDELQLLRTQAAAVAQVCDSVYEGDFTRRVAVPVQGPLMVHLSDSVNNMVERLALFAHGIADVGTSVVNGQLGSQTDTNFGGTWTELSTAVNTMSEQLTDTVRAVAQLVQAFTIGDFTVRVDIDLRGEMNDLKVLVNAMADRIQSVAAELLRVATEVGIHGRLGHQAKVSDALGGWRELIGSINRTCATLTVLGRSVTFFASALERNDYTQKLNLGVEGELLALQVSLNGLVERLATAHAANRQWTA
ncbi:hypothetical protein PHLGIDRAFT_129358 [Phlebiopsis gigantea 11061_1 CR5-6]|uniref:HAMP domain-containing protein n=1 Tax=Phlebiopsis gigantea (strain 11061_1 CR5-6) TaxID=745531 RepID=A0A0C3PG18_PHLG1|nr:hypothetical protein PHLGIDRAFT_129358 [Phlebiopsis gigantea 11061_1 CR5-6]